MEIQHNLFNEIITFLNNAPNTKESPVYIWLHPQELYPKLEKEIEHNLILLEHQQQAQYIAYLLETTQKCISNQSDVLNELMPFFEKYGTSEQKLQDFDTSGHEVVHDAFNLEIPNSLTIKYEHIEEDQITFSRLLQKHFARKNLIGLNEKLLEYVNKYNMNETTPSSTPTEIKLRSFEFLMETFDYSDTATRPTYLFYMLFVERFVSFKDEFHTNMIQLSLDQRGHYIEKLLIKLTNEMQHMGLGKDTVLERCKEYGVSLQDLENHASSIMSNPLYTKLNVFPEHDTLYHQFDTPRDIIVLQEEFYHYFYGEGIRRIVEFLNQQKAKLENQSDKLWQAQYTETSRELEKNAKQEASSDISKNPSFEKFNDLKEYLKYDKAVVRSAIMFYKVTMYQLGIFKNEFFENMLVLDDVPRRMYINKIANELEKDRKYIGQNEINVEQKCVEFNTSVEKLLEMTADDNCELFDTLNQDPCYDFGTDSFETPQSILSIQDIFYPYLYGEIVRQFFEFINEQKQEILNTALEGNQQAKKKKSKINQSNLSIHKTGFSFTGKSSKLLDILKSLQQNLNKGLVNESFSSLENLHHVLIASEFTAETKEIRFSCETTQLGYLLRKLKPFFTNFEDKHIESSKLFITSSGSYLKAGNIKKSFSDSPSPKDHAFIDKCIAELNATV